MTSIHDILTRAVGLHQAGEPERAATLYRAILSIEPAEPNSLHLLGLLTRRQGRLNEGVALMARALLLAPALAGALINQALALQDQGRLDEAAAHFRRRLAVQPACEVTLLHLGTEALSLGRIDAAERLLRRASVVDAADGRLGSKLRCALERCATARALSAEAADPSLPPGLVVRGVFRDSSGYAHKVRQLVRHLVAAGVRVRLVDLNYGDSDNLRDDQIDPLLRTLDQPVRARAMLTITTPPTVDAVPGLKTINYSVFEAATIPPLWAAHSRRHDHVMVATESSRAAWLSAGHPAGRIDVCPEGVEPAAGGVTPAAIVDGTGRRLSDHAVRVLNISDVNSRKNLPGLLRVWLRTTRVEDSAALLLKVGKGSDVIRIVRTMMARASTDTGRTLFQAAPIFLVDGKRSDAEMMSLHAASTHYWSMSHGEGWDLPMAQAGAMGLTLLAPDHSAYRAYLDERVAHMIPSRVTPASGAYRGQDWWTPDEDAAARLLRAVIDDPDGTRRSAQRHLLDHFSWNDAARRLIALLTELDAL